MYLKPCLERLLDRTHSLLHSGKDVRPLAPHPQFAHVQGNTMTIENHVYKSSAFRKLHVEYASSNIIQIAHVVLHPRATMDIPIFSLDVVAVHGNPTMCIVDPCTSSYKLPQTLQYDNTMRGLRQTYGLESLTRDIPIWGRPIFSECLVLTRGEHFGAFEAYALDALQYHLDIADRWPRVLLPGSVATIAKQHDMYKRCQRINPKTRAVLLKEFNGDRRMVEGYMRYIFD
jgi:hypothetical protein